MDLSVTVDFIVLLARLRLDILYQVPKDLAINNLRQPRRRRSRYAPRNFAGVANTSTRDSAHTLENRTPSTTNPRTRNRHITSDRQISQDGKQHFFCQRASSVFPSPSQTDDRAHEYDRSKCLIRRTSTTFRADLLNSNLENCIWSDLEACAYEPAFNHHWASCGWTMGGWKELKPACSSTRGA